MSKVLVNDTDLSGIANAIRRKNGGSTLYKPSEMPAAVDAIPTGITPTGTKNITENGTTDVTQYASANVNVPNSYSASDEGKVVSNSALVAQAARSSEITENGTYDTTLNNSVTVNVPNSYSASDEGKVVSNGALAAQSARASEITENGTYDTTLNNSVTVNVSGGGGGGDSETIEVTTSVTGGVNGGAVISISFDGTQVFTATGNSPYNMDYNNKSATITTAGGNEVDITVTPPATSTSKLGITIESPKDELSYQISSNGSNTSYGYSFTETEDLVTAGSKLITKSIDANGTYNASSDNADGYSSVVVNVRGGVVGAKNIVANGSYSASTDNLDGYSSVYVQVPQTPNSQGILVGTDNPTAALGADGNYYYKRKRIVADDDGWITNASLLDGYFSSTNVTGNEFIPKSTMTISALRTKFVNITGGDTFGIRLGSLTDIIISIDNIVAVPGGDFSYAYLQSPITLTGGEHYIVQAFGHYNVSARSAPSTSPFDANIAEWVGRRTGSFPGSFSNDYYTGVDFVCTMPERYLVEHEYYKDNGVWTQIQ